MHLSLASGGTYVALLAGFLDHLESTQKGRRLKMKIDSYSGSSAGAIAGAAMALNVPASALVQEVQKGGLHGRFPLFRAIGVYFGFRRSIYDGNIYLRRLESMCKNRRQLTMRPMTVALTDMSVKQHSLTFKSEQGLLNAAVASASIPYVFSERYVAPIGMCVDGSVNRSSFPEDLVVRLMRQHSGSIILLNTMPWPGFRNVIPKNQKMGTKKLLLQWANALYAHGMESIVHLFEPPLTFRDGSFSLRVCNRTGHLKQSPLGNLIVHFVAPTHKQFMACGGLDSAGKLSWSKNDKCVQQMLKVGRDMASSFLKEQCRY